MTLWFINYMIIITRQREKRVFIIVRITYAIKGQLTIIKRCLRHVACRYTFRNQ